MPSTTFPEDRFCDSDSLIDQAVAQGPARHAHAHTARIGDQGDRLAALHGFGCQQAADCVKMAPAGDGPRLAVSPTAIAGSSRYPGGSSVRSCCSTLRSLAVNTLPATMACAATATGEVPTILTGT